LYGLAKNIHSNLRQQELTIDVLSTTLCLKKIPDIFSSNSRNNCRTLEVRNLIVWSYWEHVHVILQAALTS